jgi:hypothetical protein
MISWDLGIIGTKKFLLNSIAPITTILMTTPSLGQLKDKNAPFIT